MVNAAGDMALTDDPVAIGLPDQLEVGLFDIPLDLAERDANAEHRAGYSI
jgi:hypothetical protein